MEKTLKLEKDYLFSERLQAPTLFFEVPVGNGLTGKTLNLVPSRSPCFV